MFFFLLKTYIMILCRIASLEAFLKSTHNLCFTVKIRKNNKYLCKPPFYFMKVGCRRSSLRGRVSMMTCDDQAGDLHFH